MNIIRKSFTYYSPKRLRMRVKDSFNYLFDFLFNFVFQSQIFIHSPWMLSFGID